MVHFIFYGGGGDNSKLVKTTNSEIVKREHGQIPMRNKITANKKN